MDFFFFLGLGDILYHISYTRLKSFINWDNWNQIIHVFSSESWNNIYDVSGYKYPKKYVSTIKFFYEE